MNYKEYWEKNINSWGQYYLEISHGDEVYESPKWFQQIYKLTIARIEKRLMDKRYNLTVDFLKTNIHPDKTFLDLGCGTGIFCVQALSLGAKVTAVDFSKNALETTWNLCRKHFEEYFLRQKLVLKNSDISIENFEKHDVCLVMGVLHYIKNPAKLFETTLANQNIIMFSYSDKHNFFNRIRRIFPFLNVRKLQFHSNQFIDQLLSESLFKTINKSELGTGFVVIAKK